MTASSVGIKQSLLREHKYFGLKSVPVACTVCELGQSMRPAANSQPSSAWVLSHPPFFLSFFFQLFCNTPTLLASAHNIPHAECQLSPNKETFLLWQKFVKVSKHQNLWQISFECLTFPHNFLDILGGQSASSLFEFITHNKPFSPSLMSSPR